MGDVMRAGITAMGYGPEPFTQDEVDQYFGAIKRLNEILQTYWAAHGKPETFSEQFVQAVELCQELYPCGVIRAVP